MKTRTSLVFIGLLSMITLNVISSQVSINNDGSSPDASSVLDVKSTSKGVLIPRLSQSERDAIIMPAHSMLIYQTDQNSGYYFNQGSAASPAWVMLASVEDCESRIPIDSLPYTINESGSYYLTASLTQNSSDNGITIASSNVSLDLNGNSLIGDPAFTASGILLSGTIKSISIKNGSISNWKNFGLTGATGNNISLTALNFSDNSYDGAFLGSGNVISYCTFENNGFDGLDVENNNVIKHCVFTNNSSDGLEVENNNSIESCSSGGNGGDGFQLNNGNVISLSTAKDNAGDGFHISNDNHLSQNIADNNTSNGYDLGYNNVVQACRASNNTLSGFKFEEECSIHNSYARGNSLHGFYSLDDNSRIENNHSTTNGQKGFEILGSANLIIKNSSSGNLSLNFSIGAGNYLGPIITGADVASSTNANSNIQY